MFLGPVSRFSSSDIRVADPAPQQNAVLRRYAIHVLRHGELSLKVALYPSNAPILVPTRLTRLSCHWLFLEREGVRR